MSTIKIKQELDATIIDHKKGLVKINAVNFDVKSSDGSAFDLTGSTITAYIEIEKEIDK